eukprot:3036134-Pyramimonas_sp.AAC.1
MASLKFRVKGGKIVICSAYAPHSGKPPEDRQHYFQELTQFIGSLSCHGPVFLCGDLNARLHFQRPGEEAIIGRYVFGNPHAQHNPESN